MASGETTEDQDGDLREKARLLLQREREHFELRVKHEQLAVWLKVGQSLPGLFLDPSESAQNVWSRVRKTLIAKLRFQRVLIVDVGTTDFVLLAPSGAAISAGDEPIALLERCPSGYCNDPAEDGRSGVVELARALGLQRFVWSRISGQKGRSILIAAGFDQVKAVFHAPFVEADAAQFNHAAKHLESLQQNFLLIGELEREKRQLLEANVNLERRDRELLRLTDELRASNESLETRVETRTRELADANSELRLVLDNVDQALVTVDLEGRLAPGHSTVVERWFGPYASGTTFVEHVRAPVSFRTLFELGLESLRADLLPREVCLAQMPRRFPNGDKVFECRVLPIDEAGKLDGLLLIVDDVTERLKRAKADVERTELVAALSALMVDRTGFLTFMNESKGIIESLDALVANPDSMKRPLHTLKGNAATFGLEGIAAACDQAEAELANGEGVQADTLEHLRALWAVVSRTGTAVPEDTLRVIQVNDDDIRRLADLAQRGVDATTIVHELERLRFEPVERSLIRLARHAEALSNRLGKGELDVQVDAAAMRLDPDRWGPLWSALVHVVRNAIDHGIELPEERVLLGKPARASLRLSAREDRGGYRFQVADDGRGIDWDAVRRLCEQRGTPAQTHADLLAALLTPNFTTRERATTVSGRGVGLAAVASVVKERRGTLNVESQPGCGACWTLVFPESSETKRRHAD